MNGVDVLEHSGEGYKRVVNGSLWTLAGLNYAARFDERNVVELERHNLTDETFVLLRGSATLLTLADGEGSVSDRVTRLPMEPLKFYNVLACRWHGIVVSEDARVLIGENADTSWANTDYLRIATGEIFQKAMEGRSGVQIPVGDAVPNLGTMKEIARQEKRFATTEC